MRLEYFTAPWCQPCKVFGPVIEDTTKRFGIRLEKINIQETPERLPSNVLGIPTVIGYVEGKEIGRFSGAKTESDLLDWLVSAGI